MGLGSTSAEKRRPEGHRYNTIAGLAFVAMSNMLRLGVCLGICGRFRHMLFYRRNQRGKSVRVMHGHVRQDFSVQLDAAHFQSVNQLAVSDAVIASGRADALNPQRAVVAFARAPVAVGVPQRAVHRFLCRAVEFSLGKEKPLRVFQQLFAPRAPSVLAA